MTYDNGERVMYVFKSARLMDPCRPAEGLGAVVSNETTRAARTDQVKANKPHKRVAPGLVSPTTRSPVNGDNTLYEKDEYHHWHQHEAYAYQHEGLPSPAVTQVTDNRGKQKGQHAALHEGGPARPSDCR